MSGDESKFKNGIQKSGIISHGIKFNAFCKARKLGKQFGGSQCLLGGSVR